MRGVGPGAPPPPPRASGGGSRRGGRGGWGAGPAREGGAAPPPPPPPRRLLQRVEQPPVGTGEVLHLQLAEGVGKLARDDEPVVQHVTQARRPLRALRHQAPAAIGATRDVESGDVQAQAGRRLRADHRPQPARVALQQRRRQQAFVQQPLRAVQVGQRELQQFGALLDAVLDGRPLGRLDEQRQQLQRPWPAGHAGLAVDVVRDTVELDALGDLADAAVQVLGDVQPARLRWQRAGETLPGRAQFAAFATQFVPDAGFGRQGAAAQRVRRRVCSRRRGVDGQRALRGHGAGRSARHGPAGRRRSTVNGNSRLGAAGCTAIAPGVWPKRKKRARRRLSASKALTGKLS